MKQATLESSNFKSENVRLPGFFLFCFVFLILFIQKVYIHTLGNSRKYPYSTTDGFLEFQRQGGVL